MSLQAAAQHLAAHGRGKDTELVHMDKGELRSLQHLAKQHGGNLTINPKTGLPEAGFLSSILPMVAGIALNSFAPGLGALGSGLLVGGLTGVATGSLGKGLMAGLGAYGGANLGQGISGLGTSEAGANASQVAQAAGEKAAAEAEAKSAAMAAQSGTTMQPPEGWQKFTPELQTSSAVPRVSPEVMAQSARDYATDTVGNSYELTRGLRPTFGSDVTASVQSSVAPVSSGLSAAQQSALSSPFTTGLKTALTDPSKLATQMGGWGTLAKTAGMAAAPVMAYAATRPKDMPPAPSSAQIVPYYKFERNQNPNAGPVALGADTQYFNNQYVAQPQGYNPWAYPTINSADGGVIKMADGGATPYIEGVSAPGVVERMSQANSVGQNTGYPLAQIHRGAYATPWQTPVSENILQQDTDTNVDPNTGEMKFARGGLSDLGGYSDGGRLLRGPGDGVSDSIPAVIGQKQPARLADGEFVVPARIVSEIGNGSTEAGARKLYAMMDRVQKARAKTTGKKQVAKNTNASKFLPA